jgi:hypothetical protein
MLVNKLTRYEWDDQVGEQGFRRVSEGSKLKPEHKIWVERVRRALEEFM